MTLADGVDVLPEDLAPGAPFIVQQPSYAAGRVQGSMRLNPNDFNGGPLSGTSSLNVFAAFYNDDGTNPLDNLGGQQAEDNGFLQIAIPVTPEQAASGEEIPYEFDKTPATNHAKLLVGFTTSDENA